MLKKTILFLSFFLAAGCVSAQTPTINSFKPDSGGVNTSVIIKGANISGATAVSFGGTPALQFYFTDSATIYAYVGKGSSGDVSITTPKGTASLKGFTFIPAPVINSFKPTQGYKGSVITIKGSGFSSVYAFNFGGVPAQSFNILSDTVATAVVDKGASGYVTANSNYGRGILAGFEFTGPIISSFTPTAGGDGTVVTIKGLNFTGATAVSFGGVPAKLFTLNSPTQISATISAGSIGDVAVTTNLGTATLPGFGRPFINSFYPYIGGPGSVVTIKGFNFTGVKTVWFGDSLAGSFTVLSDTVINAVVGNGTSGFITVKTPNDSAQASYFLFKYPLPQLNSFTPASGKFGSVITIKGQYFTSTSLVTFGGTPAKAFKVVSDSLISAVLGNGSTGDVSISTQGGTSSDVGFTYVNAPVITSFYPIKAPAGAQVTILGGHFDSIPSNNYVYFGPVKATIISATNEKLVVQVPAGAGYHPISVAAYGSIAMSSATFTPIFQGALPVFSSNSLDTEATIGTNGTIPQSIADADFDGDGKTDIVFANEISNNANSPNQSVYVLRNISTPEKIAFSVPVSYKTADTSNHGSFVLTADIDADGKLDLVAINMDLKKMSVLVNKSTIGNIQFERTDISIQPPGGGLIYPGSAAIVDFDGDGKLDIAIDFAGIDFFDEVMVLHNTTAGGKISFGDMLEYNITDAVDVTTGDFNSDDKPDIAITISPYGSYNAGVKVNASTPGKISFVSGYYPLAYSVNLNVRSSSTTIGDFDGDNKTDILLNNSYPATILRNTGDSANPIHFDNFVYDSTSIIPHTSIADVDGDGNADIVANSIRLYKNTSTPRSLSFIKESYTVSRKLNYIMLDDFDNDGKPDIVGNSLTNAALSVFRNKVGEPKVTPSGSNPVTGDVVSHVWVDSVVNSYNGSPYVQRHYQIKPANNDSTATATITLYFTQQEFDNFNAYPGHGANLPTSKNDSADKANIRIYQFHGSSLTGNPGGYPGAGIEIDPADSNIIWSDDTQCWQVTFNVTGFSGFFAASKGSSLLPVKLISFTALLTGENTALLQWQTGDERNVANYTIFKSMDGVNYTSIVKVPVKGNINGNNIYNYQDGLANITSSTIFYKLEETDKDGKTYFAKTIRLNLPARKPTLLVYPNPAKNFVTVVIPQNPLPCQLVITDIAGRTVKNIGVASNVTTITVTLQGLSAGGYNIKLVTANNSNGQNVKLLVGN